jgi:hypothetical protein
MMALFACLGIGGGAAAWVSPARAQKPRSIGSLGSASSDTYAPAVAAFVQGLQETANEIFFWPPPSITLGLLQDSWAVGFLEDRPCSRP